MKKFLNLLKFFLKDETGALWPLMLLGGAGLGAAKYLDDKSKYKDQQTAQAAMTHYSPWTGMQGRMLTPPSAFGSILQGGMTGAMLGSMMGGAGLGAGGAGAAAAPVGGMGSPTGGIPSPWTRMTM